MPEVVPWRSLSLRRRVGLIVVLLVLAAFGAFLVVEAFQDRASTRPVAHGLRAEGVVVDVDEHDGRSTTYRETVAFRTAGFRLVSLRSPTLDDRPHLGDLVPVSYDPADPARAHALLYSSGWLINLGFGILLLAFVLLLATARPRRAWRLRR